MGWGSFSYAYGPVLAVAGVALLIGVLRWAHRPGGSLIERRVRAASPEEYGMLVPVASPGTYAEGEILRRRLEDAGVRATLAMTTSGPRVMVWPADERRAADALRA